MVTQPNELRELSTLAEAGQWLELYRRGRAAWNSWVKDDAAKLKRKLGKQGTFDIAFTEKFTNADFSGYIFPCPVSFESVKFDGDTKFKGCQFEKDVSFSAAKFEGSVDFTAVKFENDVDFEAVNFERVSFSKAEFRKKALFTSAVFSGRAECIEATFSEASFVGAVFLSYADFGGTTFKGLILFDAVKFCDRSLFRSVSFEDEASFSEVEFGGDIDFLRACFQKRANFYMARFKRNDVFREVKFEGPAVFVGSQFESTVPDFKMTAFSKDFAPDFYQMKETYPRYALSLKDFHIINVMGRLGRISRHDVHENYRVLRKLANDGHNHEREQELFAKESRAKRHHLYRYGNPHDWPILVLNHLYDCCSDFGRSVVRPLVFLLLTTVISAWAYSGIDSHSATERIANMIDQPVIVASLSGSIPFAGQSMLARKVIEGQLCCTKNGQDCLGRVYQVSVVQGLVSFVFLFLMGLALRNRFRIR